MIAALYVETDGCYFGLLDVDPWDIIRDARTYRGPWPVIAHPPCQRWGRYWHGSPRNPHQFRLGADDGCFAAALASVHRWGGVLEHPAYTHAWEQFRLSKPALKGGWKKTRLGWTCHVEQGHYGHLSRKATWLYFIGARRPDDLIWGPGEQKISPVALIKHGYEKARRIGVMAMIGGKNKTRIRNATPPAFRDALIRMVTGC